MTDCIHMTAEMARNCPTCNPDGQHAQSEPMASKEQGKTFTVPDHTQEPPDGLVDALHKQDVDFDGDENGLVFCPSEDETILVNPGDELEFYEGIVTIIRKHTGEREPVVVPDATR